MDRYLKIEIAYIFLVVPFTHLFSSCTSLNTNLSNESDDPSPTSHSVFPFVSLVNSDMSISGSLSTSTGPDSTSLKLLKLSVNPHYSHRGPKDTFISSPVLTKKRTRSPKCDHGWDSPPCDILLVNHTTLLILKMKPIQFKL